MASSEVKKGTEDGEEAAVPLNFKTTVLRVSIHCEACKRKVEKILRKIGVYRTEIDLRQQMVTVTADIDADTLIQRLRKRGKHAELWPEEPEKPEKPEKPPVKAKNKERQSDPSSAEGPGKEGQSVKTEAPEKDQSAKVASEGGGKKAGKEKATQDGEPATDGAGAEAKEAKQDGEEKATASAAEKQPVAGGGEGGAEKSGGHGGAGKKKKRQGQKAKNAADGEGASSGEAPASAGPGSGEQNNHGQTPQHNAAGGGHPRQQAGPHPVPPHGYDAPAGLWPQREWPNHAAPHYPDHWYPPPQYGPPPNWAGYHAAPPLVSHHTANPTRPVSHRTEYASTSYAESHYASVPPPPHAHFYGPAMEEEHPPLHYTNYHLQPSNSFEMFSEENPNGCSIM